MIDRKTGDRKTLLAGDALSGIDISPEGREVWVIAHEQRRIHMIGVESDRPSGSVALESADFGRLRFTPDGRRVVLVQGKRFTTFDARDRKPIWSIDMPLRGKVVAVSPTGGRAVVSNPSDNKVSIVDLAGRHVVASFSVGRHPMASPG